MSIDVTTKASPSPLSDRGLRVSDDRLNKLVQSLTVPGDDKLLSAPERQAFGSTVFSATVRVTGLIITSVMFLHCGGSLSDDSSLENSEDALLSGLRYDVRNDFFDCGTMNDDRNTPDPSDDQLVWFVRVKRDAQFQGGRVSGLFSEALPSIRKARCLLLPARRQTDTFLTFPNVQCDMPGNAKSVLIRGNDRDNLIDVIDPTVPVTVQGGGGYDDIFSSGRAISISGGPEGDVCVVERGIDRVQCEITCED